MKILTLVKRCEGFSPTPYICPAGYPTIGYGFIGTLAKPGSRMTEQQASKILEQKFQGYYTAVKKSITVPVSESCLQAYASLAYNVGVKTVRESTSLRQLNEGNWRNASISFTWFNKGGGKVLPGLVKRREAEVAFWLRGMSDWDQNAIERYLDLLGI